MDYEEKLDYLQRCALALEGMRADLHGMAEERKLAKKLTEEINNMLTLFLPILRKFAEDMLKNVSENVVPFPSN